MKVCTECGEEFSDRAVFCPICGQELVAAAPVAAPVQGKSPSIVLKVLAVPALLFGAFLVVFLLITYYATIVSALLSIGAPVIVGIIMATLLLFGSVGGTVYYFVRVKK